MKNLKKLVAVVLSLAMIISTVAFSASAANYADVDKSSSYAEAVDILSGLKILQGDEQGNFNPDAEIKRSEFAAVVCRALGQENAANGAKGFSKFADVAADHWAVGYINWAAQQGIVNGRDANTFDPDASVKYQEAVKMLVAALGYEPMATVKGGYPTGYLVIAASNGITTGVSLAGEANAPRSAVAQLTYNALDVPLMDATFITTSGDDEYAIYNGKNDYEFRSILTYYLSIAKIKAIVNNTHKSDDDLMTSDGRAKVELSIDSIYNDDWDNVSDLINDDVDTKGDLIEPFIGETSADQYLGYTVVAYVGVDEDDDPYLYAISPDLKSNDIVEITKDIDSVEYDTNTLSYWENIDTDRDMTDLDIDDEAIIYINGTKQTGTIDTIYDDDVDFQSELRGAAKIVLMAPKNTDEYDKIFITRYEYAIVDSVNVDEEFIKTSVGTSIDLTEDSNADNFVYTITLDGQEIGLADLQEKDVLNVAWSGGELDENNNTFVDIIVSRKTVEGTVSETKEEGTKYGIDGVFYEKAPRAGSISIGDEGTFYLTIDDKIIDFEVTDSRSDNYAFITKYDSETKFGENAYSIKLFTKDGDLVVYPVSTTSLKVVSYNSSDEKVTDTFGTNKTLDQSLIFDELEPDSLDGITDTDQKDRIQKYNIDGLLNDDDDAHVAERLITFKTSSDEITEITFASDTSDKDVFNYDNMTADYAASTSRFGGYKIGDSSKLFFVPVDVNNDIDEDKIELKSFTSLDEDEDYEGSYIFNINSDRYFGAAVITDGSGFGGKNTGLAVVKSRSLGLDSEGNDANKLTFLQNGEEKTYIVADDATFENKNFTGSIVDGDYNEDDEYVNDTDTENIDNEEDMSKGDIFLYTLNGKDEISKVYLIYNASVNQLADAIEAQHGYFSADTDEDIAFVFGIVTDVSSGDITLSGKRLDDTGAFVGGFDQRDGSTFALFDENKTSSSSGFLTSYRDYTTLKESSESSSQTAKKYLAVAKLDRKDVTDVIEIAVKDSYTDDAVEGLDFLLSPTRP